jgi:hypothetical protein
VDRFADATSVPETALRSQSLLLDRIALRNIHVASPIRRRYYCAKL